jgi:hypothetical protein
MDFSNLKKNLPGRICMEDEIKHFWREAIRAD